MENAPDKLTADLEARIVHFVQAGGFPHVSAAAAGVAPQEFRRWLAKGRKKRGPPNYRRLVASITRAAAQARLRAEIALYEKDPAAWLAKGPGREQPGSPGWTLPVHAFDEEGQDRGSASPEVLLLLGRIHEVLTPFPEARAAVLQAIHATRSGAPREKHLPSRYPSAGEVGNDWPNGSETS